MKTAFIYALCEPGTRTVRYIGKANNPNQRFKKHLRISITNDNHLGAWLRMLRTRGEIPNLVLLREVPFETWKEEEIRYISAAKVLGMDLTNAVAGGGGCLSPSPETLKRMSDSHKGKTMPPEQRAKISAALKGHEVSSATRERISAGNLGKMLSEETRGKISKALSNPSLETRAKLGSYNRGRIRSPESRAKMSANNARPFLGKKHSVDTRLKMALKRAAYLARVGKVTRPKSTGDKMRAAWVLRKERKKAL